MALTFNGTRNRLPSHRKPSGYTDPVVTTFSDYEFESIKTFLIDKSVIDSADAVTGMTTMFNDATSGIDKQAVDELEKDFDTTKTVTAFADLVDVSHVCDHSYSEFNYLLNSVTDQVLCTVKMYVKIV